jgi:rhodanese-related sulfurtransferase
VLAALYFHQVVIMTSHSRLFGFLILPVFLAACGSSAGHSSTDAQASTGDTASDSACGTSGLACKGEDAPTSASDVARASDTSGVEASAPSADAPSTPDTAIPDAKIPDAATLKADTAVPDTSPGDALISVVDTRSADASAPQTDVSKADSSNATCTQEDFIHLTPLQLKTLLDGGEDPFLINVKGTSIKNIPGTDAVLASDVPGIEELVKHDLCANIVIYCRSGVTSQSVGSQLIAKGYKRVRDLDGGINAWEAAGYPSQ